MRLDVSIVSGFAADSALFLLPPSVDCWSAEHLQSGCNHADKAILCLGVKKIVVFLGVARTTDSSKVQDFSKLDCIRRVQSSGWKLLEAVCL
jgi:hypothetical protein